MTLANNVIVSCEPGSQHHMLSYFCVSLTSWSNLQVSFMYGVRHGCRTYRSTCFRGSRTAFLFQSVCILALRLYDTYDASASSTALTNDDDDHQATAAGL